MAASALSSYLPSSPSGLDKGEKKDKEVVTPGGGDSLEDDVTCPACSERMDGPPGRRVPKVLHCLHTLCLPCLEKSWAINNKVNVSCPICKTMTALPKDKGPSGLTNNFTVIRILELLALDAEKHIICEDCVEARNSRATHRCLECRLYLCEVHTNAHQTGRRTAAHALLTLDEVKKSEEAKTTIGARAMCSREGHEHYELSLYCETCDLVICLACTIVDHARPHHQYDFVNKAVKKHKEEINQLLTMAKGCVTKLQRTLSSVQETQKRVGVRGTEIQENVKRSFETLRNELASRESALLGELAGLVSGKERVLASQARDVSFALDNLSIGTGFCEGMLLGGTDVQVLTVRAQLMKRLAELNDLRADSEPKTNERMNFGVDLVSVTAQIAHIGWIRDSTVFGPHCYAEGDGLRAAYMDEEARFTVVTVDKDGKEIKDGGESLTISLYDEKKENALAKAAHVKDNGDGSYLVTFLPRSGTRGKCLLSILIRGVHIRESPFTVFFSTPGQDGASAELSTAEGEGLSVAFPGKAATFHIIARDPKGQQRMSGGDGFEVEIKADSKMGDPEIDMKDNVNGTYTVIYTLPLDAKGDCIVSVYLDTKHIKGSPFTIPLPSSKAALPKELGVFQEWLMKDPSSFRLLYKASRDGWSTKEFHTRCDGQGPSITLVRLSTGHIFGGYTSGSWKSAGGMFLDPDSFLFTITDGKNRKPYKCPPVTREKGAVVHHSEFGPVWCGGADLSLRLDTGKLHESYSRLQGRYRLPDGFADQSDTFLAGKYSGWSFEEVEIYGV